MNTVTDFLYGAGGCLLGYLIIGLAAAVGKLVGGLVLRFRFDHFTFFMVRAYKKMRGIGVELCNPQPYISCSMVDPKDSRTRNVIYGSFSMAVALFCTETVFINIWGTKVMPQTSFTVPMAVVMGVYTVFLLFLLSVHQKQKLGNNPAGIMRAEYEKVYGALKEGKAPSEVEIERVEYTGKVTDLSAYKKYLLMCYYHYLDLGDYENVGKVVDELEEYVPDKWPHGDIGILCELVFYYVIISPNEGRAQFFGRQFLDRMEGNEGVNCKRVFAYWLFFGKKDKGAALQIAIEAMKEVEKYSLTGCQNMERRFIEALIQRIENTP